MTAATLLRPADVLNEKLEFLAENQDLLELAEFRREASKDDPLTFALIYFDHQFIDESAGITEFTLNQFHVDLCDHAIGWALCDSDKSLYKRDAYIAPRGCGKSTWFFLILPMWAAAHGHYKFIAAFGSNGEEVQKHLATFKHELENNELLRADFPELCTPARRLNGVAAADRASLYMSESGFIFSAKGITATSLGMKVGNLRPQLIILDDIEPGEETYNMADRERRLIAIRDSIIQLNAFARVVIVGTVTMPGSLVHDLVKSVKLPDEAADWIAGLHLKVHYYPALDVDVTTGEQASLWPEKWSAEWLLDLDSVTFWKSYQNDPQSYEGGYWKEDSFTYCPMMPPKDYFGNDMEGPLEPFVPKLARTIISIDPAVTDKKKSDYTAISVIGFNVHAKICYVLDAWQIKVQPGQDLVAFVERVLEQYPQVVSIHVESNQGGQVWLGLFKPLGRRVHVKANTEPKEVRAVRLLSRYQKKRVIHVRRLPALEKQMVSFGTRGAHDDMVDSVGNGVDLFFAEGRSRNGKARFKSASYA